MSDRTFADQLRRFSADATPGPWSRRVRQPGDSDAESSVAAIVAPTVVDVACTQLVTDGKLEVAAFSEADTCTDQEADAALIILIRNHADAVAEVLEAAADPAQLTCVRSRGGNPEAEWPPCGNCPACRQQTALAGPNGRI